ncbi:hypothetical protein PVK06_005836 [Gossypium arboreum]|uniref:Uncharacterized protein n=1 Tax=Gossypium arboreum TaxID=29729 RepID=A0ABR0QWM0_GOSAR|nr:hypothetical protein PVK06_005836 [Gossypium arboreum]
MSTPYLDQFIPLICIHFTNLVLFPQSPHYVPPYIPIFTPYRRYIFGGIDFPHILQPYADVDVDACTVTDDDIDPIIDVSVDAQINVDISEF